MTSKNRKTIERIHRMFRTHGPDMVRESREMYSKHGRGYFNICLKGNEAFKTGEVRYCTESHNKELEAKLPFLTEHDVRLARYIREYQPANEVVVVVWDGRFYYVDKITDTLAPLLLSLDGVVAH